MNFFSNFMMGRSYNERSLYAPKGGLPYDGIYWIEKCWRKIRIQDFKVCRYLFVRCDNDDASWTSDEHGDWPRPLPVIPELENAMDITKRKKGSSWDFITRLLQQQIKTLVSLILSALRDLTKGDLILTVPKPALMTRQCLMEDDHKLSLALHNHPSLSYTQILSMCLLHEGKFWLIEPPICQQIPKETLWYLDLAMVSSRTMHIAWDDAGCFCPVGDLFNYAAPGEEANGFGDVLGLADDSSFLSKGDTVDILDSEQYSAN
ncbi:hypothetical protein ACOSQ3_026870 [Xanthoceras sorbifolium]